MSEVPVEVGTEGVEPPRPRRTGRHSLDLGAAGLAIVISLISLGVGIYNAQSQQRMVAATSWPFLVYDTTRSRNGDSGRITLRISNQGVGPARLKALRVRVDGRPVHGLIELLSTCCGLPAKTDWARLNTLGLITESRPAGLYRPGDGIDLLVLDRTPDNTALWDALAEARLKLAFEACYCSVLGDCWTSDLDAVNDPKPVRVCSDADVYRE